MNKMSDYGLDDKILLEAQKYPDFYPGRVLSQSKGIYRVITEQGQLYAEISGKFRFESQRQTDYPAVGDFVMLDRETDENGHGIIHQVLPRKSIFSRKAAGKLTEEQVVAANIDIIFICMSVNQDFNLRRLERYLSLAWESGAKPVVVLTKIDLTDDVYQKFRAVDSVAMGVDILGITNFEKDGYQDVKAYLSPGKTIALLGSSGVGKSTLINRLTQKELFETHDIRNDDKGRHTTTRRELTLLPDGGMIIDTPGMRELGMWNADEGLEKTFADVESFFGQCRFRDCTHTNEPGCAVAAAIEKGELSQSRWQSYLKLKNEDAYTENKADYMEQKKEKFKNIAKINKARKKR
ncbi:ribosome small subunit-dependent GTPase A [Eubacteriaceae bacterium ES2]|nr:ribosome small subunit-dependent GTPase A [Eubacteriaceae bacterium ES2]